MELAFLQLCKEAMQLEVAEYFLDMLLMGVHISGVDEDVIEVDKD